MTPKHLAAINRGRKAVGLKPIRIKKKTTIKKAPKKSKFDKTRKKSDMVAGVDYFKSFDDLLGTKKKTKYAKTFAAKGRAIMRKKNR